MDKFCNRILNTIREKGLIKGGETVIVGFSGGADSVCLLLALKKMESLLKIKLKAVHVNHCLRGDEALRDEAFCKRLCLEKNIDFEAVRADVRGYAKEKKLSLEEAGRAVRYSILLERCPKGGLIATAHHADDMAETVLLNILRGSGLRGLAGIVYKRENIIRPLLDVDKEDILRYARENGIDFVTDSTNLENDYTRNKLRNEILPVLKSDVNRRSSLHLKELAETAFEADEFIRGLAEKAVDENVSFTDDSIIIPHGFVKDRERIFRIYVIMEAIRRAGIGLKDWGSLHFSEIDRALFKGKGYKTDLPSGVKLKNEYKKTVIYKNEKDVKTAGGV